MAYRIIRKIIYPIMLRWRIASVEGLENLPKSGPALLVANHVGLQDPQLLITTLMRQTGGKKIHVIAKWKIFHTKLSQKWLGTIPLFADRSKSFLYAKELLEKGEMVLIYPEGQVNIFSEIREIKSGAARLGLLTRVPVVPIGLIRTSAPPQNEWAHRRDFMFGRVKIKIGPPLDLSPWYNLTIDKPLIKKVKAVIMSAVAKLANKTYIG
ncbi:1-acyl-sn-glycerol-3-phosphate acyltransferase [Candidatus Parcubacteria bacterium]|jgi:1-acyl-sn-glycerol-3-phosphate acyltransferase|nr:MAG: 1-acyl-sn-glycerol-3-phosphate acyltransferase [Candidatus Parcubacteria bacterium]